jgi:ribonuclease-3
LSGERAELCRRLGYSFTDPALLQRALTHRSRSGENYERLEFLGDSLLSFLIADELYRRFPGLSEGALTRLRASLVKEQSLAQLARGLELGRCLELGGGELKSGGHDRDSILADALEAIFGAVYQDGGLEAARAVIGTLYRPMIEAVDPQAILKDPKTSLQEYTQKHMLTTPTYNMLEITGEPHHQHFLVECKVPGLERAVRGEGSSRRHAEQQAAARALEQLLIRQRG